MSRSVRVSGRLITAFAACLAVAAVAFAGSGADSPASASTKASTTAKPALVANYDEQIKKDYNTRFGATNLFLPSQAKNDRSGFIQVGEFPTAEYCGHCHQDAHKQ